MTEHPSLAAALVAALAELTVVEKSKTAKAGAYSYDYADIGDIVKKSRPKLAEHGVVALTPVCDNGDGLACTVVLLHTSGERMEFGPFSFPHGKDAQATGSMVTYYRRYALVSALGMAAGDDDDGASAQPRQQKSARQEPDEPMADPGTHESIRSLIANLPDELVAEFREWYTAVGFPGIKTQDRLTVRQAEAVLNKLDDIDQPAPAAGSQQGPSDGPTSVEADTASPAAAPAAPAPVTRPATNKPSAAARAALNGEKPTVGAVRSNRPVPDDEVQSHFPGSEVVDEGSAA